MASASLPFPEATLPAQAPPIPPSGERRFCSRPPVQLLNRRKKNSSGTALAAQFDNKWISGSTITWCFLPHGNDEPLWNPSQVAVVRNAWQVWKATGINLRFKEVTNPKKAMIRIAFDSQDGSSWSYVGRENLMYKRGRTMQFGWDLLRQPGTAEHEIGHALGLEHEHQNPVSGIVWREEEVYRHFMAPPNEWDRETIDHNILATLDASQTEGSPWDPLSIMHYSFPAECIQAPPPYDVAGIGYNSTLSDKDKFWIRRLYPSLPPVATPQVIMGDQELSQNLKKVSLTEGEMEFRVPKPGVFRIQVEDSDAIAVLEGEAGKLGAVVGAGATIEKALQPNETHRLLVRSAKAPKVMFRMMG